MARHERNSRFAAHPGVRLRGRRAGAELQLPLRQERRRGADLPGQAAGGLDEQLASLFARLRQQLSAAQQATLDRDEGAWLTQRRDCGRNAGCIAQAYEDRIQALTVRLALPKAIGQCVTTAIAKIGDRFGGPIGARPIPNSMGSAVSYANGAYQVSYDWVAALARSRVGDRVRMCLVSIPTDCPPGDDRGRFYKTTNLRTGESWELPDSQHMCGGA
jgi:hypothetical protein